MINRLAFAAAAAALLGMAAPVLAQEEGGPPPALVDRLTSVARENLPLARLKDGSQVPPETPEERAQPIVPRALEVQTIDRALLSAAMNVCGLDSDELSYLPYMRAIRASARYSDKQLAYVGLLHGVALGALGPSLDASMCNPELIESIKQEAGSAPVATP